MGDVTTVTRDDPNKLSRPCNPSGELLQDQLAHAGGVGLAAHLLHHRADEGSRDGKVAAAGALIGAVMKEMRGQADAARVRELILEKLS